MNPNPQMQKARLADIRADVHGPISHQAAVLDGVQVTLVTFGVGAVASDVFRVLYGSELCPAPHVALVTGGTLGVRMADGSEEVFEAGDVMMLPPGHDAWTVGEPACTFVEFSRGNDYYVESTRG